MMLAGAAESRASRAPFPGLRSFSQDESELFFGREGQSDELARKLGQSRFVAVVGTSGSGKSSLVRAGLMPSLEGGCLVKAGSNWRIVDMRPGSRPIDNLAAVLDVARISEGGVDPALLRSSSLALLDLARQAYEAHRLGIDENLLILVDQFEELFRYKASSMDDRDEKAAFVKLLLEVTKQREFPVYVVITMRSDFLGDCARFRDLPENINAGQYLIPRMTRDQRREAIEGPVHMAGSSIASRLVQCILNDVGEDPDQLPVMQHTLMRTWYHWRNRNRADLPVDIEDYEAIGTLENALSSHADKAYAQACAKVPGRGDRIVKRIFQRLRERDASGRETRRPTPLRELCEVSEASQEDVLAVLECFRREGRSFLMPPMSVGLAGEREVDITHESLLRQWKRLQGPPSEDSGWLAEEEESRRTMVRLADRAEQQVPGKPDYLRAPLLQVALDWWNKRKPTEAWAARYTPSFRIAEAFLHESGKNEKREIELAAQREKAEELARVEQAKLVAEQDSFRKKLKIGTVFVLIILALAGEAIRESVNANRQKGIAERQTKEAERQTGIAEEKEKLAEGETKRANDETKRANDLAVTADGLKKQAENESVKDRLSRNEADSLRLATNASDLLDADPRRSLLLAFEAGDATYHDNKTLTAEAEGALHNTIEAARLQDTPNGPTGNLLSPTFSSNGRFLVGVSSKKINIWNLESDPPIQIMEKPAEKDSISGFALSDDGKYLAFIEQTEGAKPKEYNYGVCVIDVAGGREVMRVPDQGRIQAIALSPDGKFVAVAYVDKSAKLWRASDRLLVKDIPKEDAVTVVAFSPKGNYFVIAQNKTLAHLWQLGTGNDDVVHEVAALEHDGPVQAIAFSANESLLAILSGPTNSQGSDAVTLWGIDDKGWGKRGPDSKFANEKSGRISDAKFSSDGKHLVVTIQNEETLLWDVTPEGILAPNLKLKDAIKCARAFSFSSDGRRFAISGRIFNCQGSNPNDRASVRDANGNLLFTLSSDTARLVNLAFTPDGRRLAGVYYGGGVKIWNVLPGHDWLSIPSNDGGAITTVAFSPNSTKLASASSDGTAMLWDATTGHPLHSPFAGHIGPVNDVAFSPDGRYLATAGADHTAKIWNTDTGQVKTLSRHAAAVTGVAFSPNGKRIATGSSDKTAILWDTSTGQALHAPLAKHTGPVEDVAFSPDGQYLATASADHTVILWDAKTGQLLQTLLGHRESVVGVSFSRDSNFLASASQDGTAKVWDLRHLRPGEALSPLDAFRSPGLRITVRSAVFSPDRKRLATASSDDTVRIWDVKTGDELFRLSGQGVKASGIAFSPDGTRLATGGADGSILVYAMDKRSLIQLAQARMKGVEPLSLEDCKYYHVQSNHCQALRLDAEGWKLAEAGDDQSIQTAIEKITLARKMDETIAKDGVDPATEVRKIAAKSLITKGQDLILRDRDSEALQTLRRASQLDPSVDFNKIAAQSFLNSGLSLLKAGRIPDAVEDFQEARKYDPGVDMKAAVQDLLQEGDRLAATGKIDDAVKVFRNAQELDPNQKFDPEARAKKAYAAVLVGEGDKLASQGSIPQAVKIFSSAQELDPSGKIDPQARANHAAAVAIVSNALHLLKTGKETVKEAVAAYHKADELDSNSITGDNWNDLCWFGSLLESAHDVMYACEIAVKAEGTNWYFLDSHGTARALVGDTHGAIADFEEVVKRTDRASVKTQRAGWIDTLNTGQNPFTPNLMNDLRKESGVVNPAK